MSLLYGLTGSLELDPASVPQPGRRWNRTTRPLALAVVMVVVALAFKLGAVPFHMWVPDVYHGSPTSTTAFLGAAPKIAAFAMMMRLLVGGLEDLHGHVAANADHPCVAVRCRWQYYCHRPGQPEANAGLFDYLPYGLLPVWHPQPALLHRLQRIAVLCAGVCHHELLPHLA